MGGEQDRRRSPTRRGIPRFRLDRLAGWGEGEVRGEERRGVVVMEDSA